MSIESHGHPSLVAAVLLTHEEMSRERFSSRKGLVTRPAASPPGELSDSTRMGLWNSFHEDVYLPSPAYRERGLTEFWREIHVRFLGQPIDEYPGNARLLQTIKGIFLASKWWLVFDILETALDMQDVMDFAEEFAIESINKALADSAYMLVYHEITERLPVEQSASIETALTAPFSSARTHFEKAFRALNRRPECEPGEVIRESIHAVEATCRELCGDQNAELGKALAKLDKQHQFHPVLRQAIEKLYAWTGDASGARHALKEEQWRKTGKAEAQFALVTCSAIANYLIAAAMQ
jgi:hypothetical protein